MLTTLRIRNLALVTDLTLELPPGYLAITGETGAGKSILIGALNLVLGERADRTLIRAGADHCAVEAVFDLRDLSSPIPGLLEANGLEPCVDGQLVLKREFSSSGVNRQYVNGSPTTLNVLAALGQWLVDIHGPHDHQSLLQPTRQLALLDAFGGLEGSRQAFAERVVRRRHLEERKAGLVVDERTYAQQLDLLRHQVQEITAARLQAGEDEQIEADYQRASNAARLLELSQAAFGCLTEDENSVLNQLGAIGRRLLDLKRLDSQAGPLLDLQEQAASLLRELQGALARYADGIDLDPARLQAIEERLNLIQSLKRKYGSNVADVIAFGETTRQKLHQWEQREEELTRLDAELKGVDDDLWRVGQQLSGQRRKTIPKFARAVMRQLGDLGFQQSLFHVQITTRSRESVTRGELVSQGLDSVEFLFAPNPGEPERPLRAIASSGEIARVMLALKTVLANEDNVPVLIFDEVDANVGGETAAVVGEKMRQIGRKHQVLCVTHLAPVAACAAAHFVVSKRIQDDRTLSEVHLLDARERVTELARMLGGQSEAARRHAQALIQQVNPVTGNAASTHLSRGR